jgi:hypothetical protein
MELLSSLKNIDIVKNIDILKIPKINIPLFTSFMPFKMEGFFQDKKDVSGNVVSTAKSVPPPTVFRTFITALLNSIYLFTYIAIILFIGMLVSNDMINLPIPMRIFGFSIATFLSLSPPGIFLFIIYYGLRVFYAISMNYILDRKNPEKRPYYPKLFALLPIYNGRVDNSFLGALMYPFTYPKSDISQQKLINLVNKYKEELDNSFGNNLESYLKTVSGDAKESYDSAINSVFTRHKLQ